MLPRSCTKAQDRVLRAPTLRKRCDGSGWQTSGMRLSEEEIVHLGAWLAPEVVLLSRSPELEVEGEAQTMALSAKGGSGGGSAYHGIVGSGDAGNGKSCTLTPATDIFGLARVMQELFEPHCAHRFCRPISISSERKSMHALDVTEERKLHFHLRPAIKKALQRDYTARGGIEDLYIAIVRAIRVGFCSFLVYVFKWSNLI